MIVFTAEMYIFLDNNTGEKGYISRLFVIALSVYMLGIGSKTNRPSQSLNHSNAFKSST